MRHEVLGVIYSSNLVDEKKYMRGTHLETLFRAYKIRRVVFWLDCTRVNAKVVKCFSDLHSDRHKVMSPRGQDMNRSNNLVF